MGSIVLKNAVAPLRQQELNVEWVLGVAMVQSVGFI